MNPFLPFQKGIPVPVIRHQPWTRTSPENDVKPPNPAARTSHGQNQRNASTHRRMQTNLKRPAARTASSPPAPWPAEPCTRPREANPTDQRVNGGTGTRIGAHENTGGKKSRIRGGRATEHDAEHTKTHTPTDRQFPESNPAKIRICSAPSLQQRGPTRRANRQSRGSSRAAPAAGETGGKRPGRKRGAEESADLRAGDPWRICGGEDERGGGGKGEISSPPSSSPSLTWTLLPCCCCRCCLTSLSLQPPTREVNAQPWDSDAFVLDASSYRVFSLRFC